MGLGLLSDWGTKIPQAILVEPKSKPKTPPIFVCFFPDDFQWEKYLEETGSLSAPSEYFRQVCQNSVDTMLYLFL